MKINVKIKGIIFLLIISLFMSACKEKQHAEIKYGLVNDSVDKVLDKAEEMENNMKNETSEDTKAANEKATETIYGMEDIN